MYDKPNEKKRIEWVDIAKCLCIFMVLLSHMEYVPTFFQCIFKPFFLTAFFFLTGYVFNGNRTFTSFICNRIRTLLFPAILFSVIYLLDFKSILHGNYSLQMFANDISVLLRQQRGQGDVLWFLYVSFLAEIPLFFLNKYVSKKLQLIISFVLCELSIVYVKHFMVTVPYWYVHIVFVAMFFMVIGSIYKEKEQFLDMYLKNPYIFALSFFAYLTSVFVLQYKFGIFVNINDYAANQAIWFLVVFIGIYLCIWIAKKLPKCKFMLYCGRNTLIFYLLHDRVRGVINYILQKTSVWNIIFKNNITKTVAVLVVCFVEILILMCLSALILRFLPFIVGRKYPRKKKSAEV